MSDKPEQTEPVMTGLDRLQTVLSHTFSEPALLAQALTHPSYTHEHVPEGGEAAHNQRLEFLGDAVLDFLVAAWLYRTFPDLSEGVLTRLRATLVCTESLAALAQTLGVGEALRLGHGEEANGGRTRPANLCDAMEAIVGALYLDGGLDTVWRSLGPWFEHEAHRILHSEAYVDAKSRYQEWAQAKLGVTPVYRIVAAEGPDHAKAFTAQVVVGDQVTGQGTGRSKRAAEQAAALDALQRLTHIEPEEPAHDAL